MTATVKTQGRHAAPRRRRPIFPHFSNFLLGNIYQALTGTIPVRPSLFKRAVANGLARDEFTEAVHQAKTQSQLATVLLSTAQDRLNKALYWNELGLKTRARDFFLDATLWAINAEPFIEDEQERERISHQYKNSYSLAAPYFASPANPVEISYLGSTLQGYLRYPQTAVSEDIKREG